MACIIWVDFLKDRPYFKKFTDRSATNIIKLLCNTYTVLYTLKYTLILQFELTNIFVNVISFVPILEQLVLSRNRICNAWLYQ